jgi:hypothetical protein
MPGAHWRQHAGPRMHRLWSTQLHTDEALARAAQQPRPLTYSSSRPELAEAAGPWKFMPSGFRASPCGCHTRTVRSGPSPRRLTCRSRVELHERSGMTEIFARVNSGALRPTMASSCSWMGLGPAWHAGSRAGGCASAVEATKRGIAVMVRLGIGHARRSEELFLARLRRRRTWRRGSDRARPRSARPRDAADPSSGGPVDPTSFAGHSDATRMPIFAALARLEPDFVYDDSASRSRRS